MKNPHKGIYKISDPSRKKKWCWERRVQGKRARTFFFSLEEAIVCKRKAEADAKANGANLRLVFNAKMQKEYLTAKEIVGGISLVDVALFYQKHHEKFNTKTILAQSVVKDVLENAIHGEPTRHQKGLIKWSNLFAVQFKDRPIDSVTPKEVFKWVLSFKLAPGSMVWVMQKITFLFKRAKSLGLLREFNGFDKSFLPKVEKTPVEVYSTKDVARILVSTHKNNPQWLSNIALRSFVGLRTAEAHRMRWEWIDMERKKILIPAKICKTRDDWVLQSPNLPDTVFKWLELTPKEKRVGRIPSPPRSLIGRVEGKVKRNGFRHTFCTMHISLYGSADKTSTLLKHKGTSMLYSYYLGKLVSEEEARDYFNLTPQSLSLSST